MPTHLLPPTHRPATEDELVDHDHEWRIVMTHSLLPGGDGHTLECSDCGAIRELMAPTGGPRTETFWVPIG